LYAALGDAFSPVEAVAVQVGATLASFLVGTWLLRRFLPPGVKTAAAESDRAAWRRSTLPLLLLNVVMAANAQVGTIMLSAISGAVLNIGLAAALIPGLGVDGAAIAVAVSLTASNIAMTWLAWRRLDVWAGVLRLGIPAGA